MEGERIFCPGCNSQIDASSAFCPVCGKQILNVAGNSFNDAGNPGVVNAEYKKKHSVVLPVIIIAVCIVAVIGIIMLLKPSVSAIVLSEDTIELYVDESALISYAVYPDSLSDTKITWISSDTQIAVVDDSGNVTAISAGTCMVTAKAGNKTDSITINVKSGPNFQALYDEYCDSEWAAVGSDGSYLSIDTNPDNEDDNGIACPEAYYAIMNINEALGLPDSLLEDMGSTTALMGKQSETYSDPGVTVSWSYHPDNGLEVTYKLSN